MTNERFESFVIVRTHLKCAVRSLHAAQAVCPNASGRLQRDIRSLKKLVESLEAAANARVQETREIGA